jgi:DNA repair exonuclease SbcCD nuclease subunit
MRFIHTADWQIGKPFARISDSHKRSLVQQARIDAIKSIGALVREVGAECVLVAGDLFDSTSVDKAAVSAACSAIGGIGVPVIAIPGNHDHGGPGSIWEQDFFGREREALAPNLVVLREATPYELDSAMVLPCPLTRRTVVGDPTEWLRAGSVYTYLSADKPRIVLAHGSTQTFGGDWDNESESGPASNLIDLERIPAAEVDFIALGDWHGTKQIGPKAWYSGAHEPDHFAKGDDYDTGNVLLVEVSRGGLPQVTPQRVGRLKWRELSFDLADDSALSELESRLTGLLGQRASEDLLRLTLSGALGVQAAGRLEQMCESLEARLLRLKLVDQTRLAPTDAEIRALTAEGSDPLVARVAERLVKQASGEGDEAVVARVALRELHAACMLERAR